MKRCVNAALILYCCIFDLFMEKFLAIELEKSSELIDTINQAVNLIKLSNDDSVIKDIHEQFAADLKRLDFFRNFKEFRDGLVKQGKFLNNVLCMIENMLLYMRATRQQLWNLHLGAKNIFTKYYFALDLLFYARMSPVYLSAMYNLRIEDPESWKFIKTNFCVKKSKKGFVAIGVDHAQEQVNKELKA